MNGKKARIRRRKRGCVIGCKRVPPAPGSAPASCAAERPSRPITPRRFRRVKANPKKVRVDELTACRSLKGEGRPFFIDG